MNTDTAGTEPDGIDAILTDTFVAHEQLAPQPDDVWPGLAPRLERPARPSWIRPLAAAACVATAAGVALGAVAVTRTDRHGTASSPTPPAANTSLTPPTTDRSPAIRPVTMPFDLTWLPPGKIVYGARRINVGGVRGSHTPSFDGEYLFHVEQPTSLDIDVQQMPGALAGSAFKSGAGRHVTINGRPGYESVHSGGPGGYEIYFETSGGLVYVNVSAHGAASAPAARVTAVGRRVARGVRFPGTTQYAPAFGVGYVPPALRVTTFDLENTDYIPVSAGPRVGTVTEYALGSTPHPQAVLVGEAPSANPARGRPGRDVQGHATRLTNDNGYRTVVVLDAVHGMAVDMTGRRSFAQLYRIADGLVLPG